jgi:hypothetical protein
MLKYLKLCRFNNTWRINKKTVTCTQDITAITCSSYSKIQVTFDQDCIWKVQYRNNNHGRCKFHCYEVKLRTAGSFISSRQSLIWSRHSPPFTDPDGWCHIHNIATRPYPSTHSPLFLENIPSHYSLTYVVYTVYAYLLSVFHTTCHSARSH